MKAAVARRYGPPDVVALVEVPLPPLRPGQVHVEVGAAAVTVGDARIRAARAPGGMGLLMRLAFGLTRPRRPVLGMMFAGRMASAGTRFDDGDRVIGSTGMAMGAHAEILAVDEARLQPLSDLSDSDAVALLFGGMTAADFLIDKARLRAGQRLLVNGATGEVGVAALQIARHLGAVTTAVAVSGSRVVVDAGGIRKRGLAHGTHGAHGNFEASDFFRVLRVFRGQISASATAPSRFAGRRVTCRAGSRRAVRRGRRHR